MLQKGATVSTAGTPMEKGDFGASAQSLVNINGRGAVRIWLVLCQATW